MPASHSEKKYVLGPFLVDCQRRKIWLDDVGVDVHWRSFEALRALLAADGEVVDRNRLMELLWSGVAVEESNLHKYISQLRKALNARDPAQDYIETVPRLGYRLAVPAHEWLGDTSEPAPEVKPQPPPRRGLASRWISGVVIALLGITTLISIARWTGQRTKSSECEQSYSVGMDLVRRRDLPSVRAATEELRRVVQTCPQFAQAWAGLAEASSLLYPEDTESCLRLAERSVQLDPACGECRAILGFVLFSRHWRWKQAEEHLRRAIALTPNDPQARYWLAQWEAAHGRPHKALELINDALQRSPQGMNLLVMKAGCLYFARDFGGAVQVADQALAVNLPGAWLWRAKALFRMGREAEAVRSLAFALGSWSSLSAEAISQRAGAFTTRYHEVGLEGPLGDLLRSTSTSEAAKVQSLNRANWFMLLGNPDAALRELEVAVEARVFDLIYLRVDPLFDPIREQPQI